MPNIVISDLRPAGAELFDGCETFMNDLSDSELHITKGGTTPAIILAAVLVDGAVFFATATIINAELKKRKS